MAESRGVGDAGTVSLKRIAGEEDGSTKRWLRDFRGELDPSTTERGLAWFVLSSFEPLGMFAGGRAGRT